VLLRDRSVSMMKVPTGGHNSMGLFLDTPAPGSQRVNQFHSNLRPLGSDPMIKAISDLLFGVKEPDVMYTLVSWINIAWNFHTLSTSELSAS